MASKPSGPLAPRVPHAKPVSKSSRLCTGAKLQAGAEMTVILDLVIGPEVSDVEADLYLHWANDLPGALAQIRRALKPDGLFLGAMFGAGTLIELRDVLTRAELEVTGGAAPRVSPFADAYDAAGLMQRAGFALPVVDGDTVAVRYADMMALVRDLRGMGEAGAPEGPKPPLSRRTVARASGLYEERHSVTSDDARPRVQATFETLFLTGWAPSPDQPKPLKPGSVAPGFRVAPRNG